MAEALAVRSDGGADGAGLDCGVDGPGGVEVEVLGGEGGAVVAVGVGLVVGVRVGGGALLDAVDSLMLAVVVLSSCELLIVAGIVR